MACNRAVSSFGRGFCVWFLCVSSSISSSIVGFGRRVFLFSQVLVSSRTSSSISLNFCFQSGLASSSFLTNFFLQFGFSSDSRFSLIFVRMESRRRGFLFFFSTSPWRHFFPRGFVDGYDRDSGLLFPSLVLDVIFLYRLGGVFGHLDFPGFPIDRWVVFLEPR